MCSSESLIRAHVLVKRALSCLRVTTGDVSSLLNTQDSIGVCEPKPRVTKLDGWWILRLERTSQTRVPKPMLSDLCSAADSGARRSDAISPPLGSQARLHLTGTQSFGDDVYDVVGVSTEATVLASIILMPWQP